MEEVPEILSRPSWGNRRRDTSLILRQRGRQTPAPIETRVVIRLAKINGAADGRVHGGAAQFLMADGLADGGRHKRWTCQVQAAPVGHERLVAQDRQGAACRDAVAE